MGKNTMGLYKGTNVWDNLKSLCGTLCDVTTKEDTDENNENSILGAVSKFVDIQTLSDALNKENDKSGANLINTAGKAKEAAGQTLKKGAAAVKNLVKGDDDQNFVDTVINKFKEKFSMGGGSGGDLAPATEDKKFDFNSTTPLASIPLIGPAVMFTVDLEPKLNYSFFFNVKTENLKSMVLGFKKNREASRTGANFDAVQTSASEDGQPVAVPASGTEKEIPSQSADTASQESGTQEADAGTTANRRQLKRSASLPRLQPPPLTGGNEGQKDPGEQKEKPTSTLKFNAGLRLNLGLAINARLVEGIPLILQAFQGLKAEANLEGNGEQKSSVLEAGLDVPLELNDDNSVSLSSTQDIKARLHGGFDVKGSFSFTAGFESDIFAWNKDLYEKKFGEWDIAAFSYDLGLKKMAGDRVDFASFLTERYKNYQKERINVYDLQAEAKKKLKHKSQADKERGLNKEEEKKFFKLYANKLYETQLLKWGTIKYLLEYEKNRMKDTPLS